MTAPFSESPPVPASSSVIDLARAFVEEHHPYASASVLGESAAAGTATSTSDLDIAVLYPNGHSNYAATTRYCGWFVEEFVHTEESLDSWYQKEAVERRPVIADLCARGILLTDNGAGAEWQTRAREQMARGPMALGDGERDLRRYNLSALIDDLATGTPQRHPPWHRTSSTRRPTCSLWRAAVGLAAANGSSVASASMTAIWRFTYAIGLEIPAGMTPLSLYLRERYWNCRAVTARRDFFGANAA
jgi:hypothetical protein